MPKNLPANGIPLTCIALVIQAFTSLMGRSLWFLYNLRQPDGPMNKPLTKGKIQIQSEGAEVFYRNLEERKLPSLPEKLLR